MRILLDKITSPAKSFPVALSSNSRHSVTIVAEDNGGTATVSTNTQATPFGRFTQFKEQPNGSRLTFYVDGIPDAVEDETVVAKNGVVLTSGITVTGNKVVFTVAPAAGDVLSVFRTRAGSWVSVLAVPFVASGASSFEFGEIFAALRVDASVVTTAKVTATIAGRNR
jgi:hypothetical protein